MDHINSWAKNPQKISRSKIELAILDKLDKARFPIEWKMAWYNAILNSDCFEVMWTGAQQKYSLSDAAVARYVPDASLCTYSLDDCIESIDDHSSGGPPSGSSASINLSFTPVHATSASSHASSTPVRTASTSKDSSETLQGDHSDESMEEVWYGEQGHAQKDSLAAFGGKQIGGGPGKDVTKAKARKPRDSTKSKSKPRAKKAATTKLKVTKQ